MTTEKLDSRTLVHLLALSVLLTGAVSDPHFRTEMEISEPPGLAQAYQRHQFERNGTTGERETTAVEAMFQGIEKGGQCTPAAKGRSLKFKLGERFAFRKRLQFALLPIMYKMGVMTTLLTGLTVLVLKGLTIGVVLLILAFGNYFSKLHKQSYQSPQPIHVHVHSQDGKNKVSSFPHAIGPWSRVADEVHPNAYLTDDGLESYRRRLIQNSAAMVRLRPLS